MKFMEWLRKNLSGNGSLFFLWLASCCGVGNSIITFVFVSPSPSLVAAAVLLAYVHLESQMFLEERGCM